MGYVVEIKASARRRSAAAGEWVNGHGVRRTFATKADAREWARDADGRVWVQDAVPHDRSPVDGYVVGGRRGDTPRSPDRDPPGEQTPLDRDGTASRSDPDGPRAR